MSASEEDRSLARVGEAQTGFDAEADNYISYLLCEKPSQSLELHVLGEPRRDDFNTHDQNYHPTYFHRFEDTAMHQYHDSDISRVLPESHPFVVPDEDYSKIFETGEGNVADFKVGQQRQHPEQSACKAQGHNPDYANIFETGEADVSHQELLEYVPGLPDSNVHKSMYIRRNPNLRTLRNLVLDGQEAGGHEPYSPCSQGSGATDTVSPLAGAGIGGQGYVESKRMSTPKRKIDEVSGLPRHVRHDSEGSVGKRPHLEARVARGSVHENGPAAASSAMRRHGYRHSASGQAGLNRHESIESKSSELSEMSVPTSGVDEETQEESEVDRQYITGKWVRREEALLINLVYCFAARELKDIAQIAYSCGIIRSSRSIDKKLKRVLGFDKWRKRNVQHTRQAVAEAIKTHKWELDDEADRMALNNARKYLADRNIPSFEPIWITPDPTSDRMTLAVQS